MTRFHETTRYEEEIARDHKSRRKRIWFAIAGGFVIAFAVGWFLLLPPRYGEPLPHYSLTVSLASSESDAGGVDADAGDPDRVHLAHGGSLQILLKPDAPLEGKPVGIATFIDHANTIEPLAVGHQLAQDGSIHLTLPSERLRTLPADAELVIFVGRPAFLPNAPNMAADKLDAGAPALQVFRKRLHVVDRGVDAGPVAAASSNPPSRPAAQTKSKPNHKSNKHPRKRHK